MNSKTRNHIMLFVAVIICACSPALYIPSTTEANRVGISADSLMLGRTLYTNHCGSCHNLHLPEQYTSTYWQKEIPEMKRKAKISDEEAKLITKFVLARSKVE